MTEMKYYKKGDAVISSVNKVNGLQEITKEEFDLAVKKAKESICQHTNLVDSETALNTFASTLASSQTNSIAKIRLAAEQFLQDTEAGADN